MTKNIVNHRLELKYEDFFSMNMSLQYSQIGKYQIYEKIGFGAFGEVYKGRNKVTNKEVAIKLINVEKARQIPGKRLRQITLRLIKDEDLLMRICESPNVVKCYDVYENESLKLMMLQFCNRGTLEDYIRERGHIPEKQAILIFKQILNGLSECHSHTIIHRDLKSQNVLIHNGIFKIADFGFSKQLNFDQEEQYDSYQRNQGNLKIKHDNKALDGTSLGTLTNMAPEVMTKKPYGLKADIWSVGIILFQMVFGNMPYRSRNKADLIEEIKESRILVPKIIKFKNITASAQMSDFLKRLLVIKHQQRIGWKQLLTHPIFNKKIDENDPPKFPRSQIIDIDLLCPQDLDLNLENLSDSFSQILKKVKVVTQDSVKILRRVPKEQSKSYASIKMRQTQIFMWINENLVECLKIELVYEQIIAKLEGYKMLDFDERLSIQLMYLLITRCFLNISPINEEMSKLVQENLFIKQIYPTVKTLYQKIHEMFLKYSQKLTNEQDKFLNKISDFFKSKEQLQKVDKYFNGIENYDFKKEEQLHFIQKKYIDELKNKLTGPEDVRQRVRKLLTNYYNINQIQFKNLQKIDFDEYVKSLL